MVDYQKKIDLVIRDICELDDRTSPEDYPDYMLVLPEELDMIIKQHFEGDEPTEVESLNIQIQSLRQEIENFKQYKTLYSMAIINAKKRKNQLNWAHVASLGVGSGRAVELCKEFGSTLVVPACEYVKKITQGNQIDKH